MKFRLLSDLHNEFEQFVIPVAQDDSETVLILAGDIDLGTKAQDFIADACGRFAKVVYVLGNHEFYRNEYHKVRRQWREMDFADNFIFLDDSVADLGGVRVIGGTMWTDYDGNDWHKKFMAKEGMNDFHVSKINDNGNYRKMRPDDVVKAHNVTRIFFQEELEKDYDGKTVVVTHHLPHPLCVPGRFRAHPLNAAYMVNLDAIIERYDIDVWCHGHTHDNVDVEVHGTRILCNPRGYAGHELNHDFDPLFAFEL